MWRYLPLAVIAAFTAVIVGWAGAHASAVVYAPVLVPVALAAVLSLGLGVTVHYLSLRSTAGVLAVAIAAWCLCLTSFHFTEYQLFIRDVRAWDALENVTPGHITITEAETRELAEEVLVETVGHGGFRGFLTLRLTAGLRLKALGGEPAGRLASTLLWSLEILIGLAVLLRVVWGVLRRVRAGAGGQPGAAEWIDDESQIIQTA